MVAMDTTYLLCFSCSLLLKLEQERFKAFLKWTTRMIQSISKVDISDIMTPLPMDHSMNSRLLGWATWYCQHHQYNTTVISIGLRSQVSIAAPPLLLICLVAWEENEKEVFWTWYSWNRWQWCTGRVRVFIAQLRLSCTLKPGLVFLLKGGEP